jgi:DNA-binding response OmpR family regulator
MPDPGWILIVEDDDDIREVMRLVLAERGYHADGVCDGEAALAYLRAQGPPALILLDLMMPRLSGAGLLKVLRADRAFASVPVVIISGDGHGREVAQGLGATSYLAKPMDLEQLVQVVDRFGCAYQKRDA